MRKKNSQRRREPIVFILIAFLGISILTYQYLDFNYISSVSQFAKRNKEHIQPRKTTKIPLAECNETSLLNLASKKKYLLKNISQSNSNTLKYPLTEIPICVNTKVQESICKHSLYWSKSAFTSSWKEMIQPCLDHMNHVQEVNRQNMTSIEKSDIVVEKNIEETVLYIKIYSKTQQEELKRVGGDSWTIKIINSNISFTVDMLDRNDGTYETFISVPADGQYKIVITILQSICEGFMDPPKDYFKKGKRFCYDLFLSSFY